MAWCGARRRSRAGRQAERTSAPADSAPRVDASSRELHVFEITRLVVDADTRRRDPACELAGLDHLPHQALDEVAVILRRQPRVLLLVPPCRVDQLSARRRRDVLELADLPVERHVRQLESEAHADPVDDLVPAIETALAVGGVVVAQAHVDGGERGLVHPLDLAIDELEHRVSRALELVVILDLGLLEAALEAGVEGVRRVGGNLRAEQVEGQRIVQVELLLNGRQIDDAEVADLVDIARVLDAGRLYRLAGALNRAADAGLADEHVVRLLGEHEAAGARQRVKTGLREAFELHLAVAIGEEGEHVEGEPVRRRLIEGAEHARLVGVAGAALQQLLGLLAAVAAEIFLQDIDHGPEMPALLDIDLKDVAHVVERGCGLAEMALLLDRGGLGVALDDDETAQHSAVFARHLLPGGLAVVLAERNRATLLVRRQQDAPAVLRHLHVIELGPALGIDRNRGAQIDERLLEAVRPHGLPPVDIAGMPTLERAEHLPVLGEIDVVRDLGRVIDVDDIAHGVLL